MGLPSNTPSGLFGAPCALIPSSHEGHPHYEQQGDDREPPTCAPLDASNADSEMLIIRHASVLLGSRLKPRRFGVHDTFQRRGRG